MRNAVLFLSALAALSGWAAAEALADDAEFPASSEITEVRPLAPPDDTVGPPKPVVVVNPSDHPVLVAGEVRVIEAARQPFNKSEHLDIQDGEALGFTDIATVPPGKQLVVTHASVRMPDGARMGFSISAISNGFSLANHPLIPLPSGPIVVGGGNTLVATQPLNMLLFQGTELSCRVIRDSTAGIASGFCSVSGYLVDAP